MKALRIFGPLVATAVTAVPAMAQNTNTVQGWLDKEFTVVGSIMTKEGAGLFLQKKDQLVFCVVGESKGSPEVTTRYCKPVR